MDVAAPSLFLLVVIFTPRVVAVPRELPHFHSVSACRDASSVQDADRIDACCMTIQRSPMSETERITIKAVWPSLPVLLLLLEGGPRGVDDLVDMDGVVALACHHIWPVALDGSDDSFGSSWRRTSR